MAKKRAESIPRDLMTVKEVCDLLRVSEMTISRWVFRGKIRAIRVGRCIRISEAQLFQDLKAFSRA